jgi:gliding-associated putative ABC transporter substrate-binding component GldG
MNGGKVLWLLESQHAEMDSLRSGNLFVTTTYPTKLEDMLFRYGVRLNPGIVQDLQCNAIPVLSGMRDGVPQQKLLPWPYFPVAAPIIDHPIVKGIDPVWFQFSAAIDTLANKEIKKTILLQSSPYSRIIGAPARVDLNVSRLDLQPEMFRRKSTGNFPLAVLLEGTFHSIFEYRFDAQKNPGIAFKNKVENNKMIVIADGDVIRNQFKQSTGEVFPLGFDRYTNEQFGNKKFIQNCIDYLCDDSGIIEIRAKEITLRLLDKGKIKKEKLYWTVINTCLPIVFILLFGVCNHYIRKRKYTKI